MKTSTHYTARTMQALSVISSVVVLFVISVTSFLGLGGMKVMHVVSDSMVPTFKTGDVLLVSTQDKDNIHENDMIAYTAEWLNNKTVTHRVKSVNKDKIITQGDNNSMSDPEFSKDKVVGKITAIVPKMGQLFSPSGVIGLAVGSIGLLVAAESIEKQSKKKTGSKKVSESSDVIEDVVHLDHVAPIPKYGSPVEDDFVPVVRPRRAM